MTVAGGETCAAYDAFAPYYDAFTSESDYDAWARETLAHARLHGLRGDRLTGAVRPATLGRSYVYDLRTMTVTREDVPVVPGCPVCAGAAAS